MVRILYYIYTSTKYTLRAWNIDFFTTLYLCLAPENDITNKKKQGVAHLPASPDIFVREMMQSRPVISGKFRPRES